MDANTRKVLEAIANMDPVDAALDPMWAIDAAKTALLAAPDDAGEPVAFMGRAPGWGWDFEPGDSGPDPTWTECYPLYTHPAPDLRAELAEAQEDLRHEVAFRHEQEAKWGKVIDDALAVANRAEAEREILRALLQGILDNHGHVFEHQIAEIRAALSKSK